MSSKKKAMLRMVEVEGALPPLVTTRAAQV